MSHLKTVRLYGQLGARFGRVHRFYLETNSTAEAIRALCSQCKGFEAYLTQAKDNNTTFAIFSGTRNLSKNDLWYPTGDDDIRIAPVTIGSKKSGLIETIIGIVIIVVAEIATDGAATPALTGAGFWGAAEYVGIMLIIAGVSQMIAPHPKGMSAKDNSSNTPNYNFNGPVNTQAQGHPVPVLYGELIVGSAVISAGISIDDHSVAYSPGSAGTVGFAGGGGDMVTPRIEQR